MRFSLSVAVAAMILFVCLNACGGWVSFKDGDGYWAFCNAVGNQELEIREKRLDGGYVEYSTLAVIAGHENIVRDSVLTFVDGFGDKGSELIDTPALTHLACLWYSVNHEEDKDNRALLVLSSDEPAGTSGVFSR